MAQDQNQIEDAPITSDAARELRDLYPPGSSVEHRCNRALCGITTWTEASIDPGGSDKIDELEQALQFAHHDLGKERAENARLRAELAAADTRLRDRLEHEKKLRDEFLKENHRLADQLADCARVADGLSPKIAEGERSFALHSVIQMRGSLELACKERDVLKAQLAEARKELSIITDGNAEMRADLERAARAEKELETTRAEQARHEASAALRHEITAGQLDAKLEDLIRTEIAAAFRDLASETAYRGLEKRVAAALLETADKLEAKSS